MSEVMELKPAEIKPIKDKALRHAVDRIREMIGDVKNRQLDIGDALNDIQANSNWRQESEPWTTFLAQRFADVADMKTLNEWQLAAEAREQISAEGSAAQKKAAEGATVRTFTELRKRSKPTPNEKPDPKRMSDIFGRAAKLAQKQAEDAGAPVNVRPQHIREASAQGKSSHARKMKAAGIYGEFRRPLEELARVANVYTVDQLIKAMDEIDQSPSKRDLTTVSDLLNQIKKRYYR